jgi:hypothetical protein
VREPAGRYTEVVEETILAAEEPEQGERREESAEFAPQAGDSEGRSGRRRRKRRRRGRGPRETGPEPQPVGLGPPEMEDIQLELPEDEEEASSGATEERLEMAEAAPSERRPERRRSRRGRSRGRDRERNRDEEHDRDSAASKAVGEEDRYTDDDQGTLDLPEATDEEFDDGADADVASAKAGFRSIPTWQEAVGLLVSANLDARARRPGNGGPPGRGGRGPRDRHRSGGNRGSRPRSGKRH